LFTTKDEDSDLKLIDFGLSKHFKVGVPLCEKVGTPYTVAPEILKGNYDEKCDMWCKCSVYLLELMHFVWH
jgi:calcium-dependent protein kinase